MTPWPFGGGSDDDTDADESSGGDAGPADEGPLGSGADLLGGVPGATFVVGDAGTVVAANGAAESTLGGGRSLDGVRVSRLFPDGLPMRAIGDDTDRFATASAVSLDGRTRDLLVQVGPQTAAGRMVVCVPLTAVPEPTDDETFVAGVSHELKQPLSTVVGHLQLLEEVAGDDLDPDARRSLEHARTGTQRALDLLEDLAAYARVGAGHVERAPVDLSDLLDGVVEDVASDLEGTLGDEWEVRWDDLPPVHGDPTQLRLLFTNLVSNGLKHQAESPRVVTVSATSSEDAVRVTVSDNGVGIPADERETIFEAFERGTGAEAVAGDGLGLMLCRRIVDHLGGRIEVDSTPGEGSSFHVHVPSPEDAVDAPDAETDAPTEADETDTASDTEPDWPVSLVLVDDVEGMRSLLRTVLERTGRYEVVGEAGDGEAGIETVRAEAPELVLLDLSMPRMDGLEALPEIRESNPGATVVVYSGFQRDRMEEKVLGAGAAAYLEKGIGPEEIVAELDDIVEETRAAAEAPEGSATSERSSSSA